jgi:hypothetical protein
MGDATFLQRLFVGWNRLSVVKEKVGGQRISTGLSNPARLDDDHATDSARSIHPSSSKG